MRLIGKVILISALLTLLFFNNAGAEKKSIQFQVNAAPPENGLLSDSLLYDGSFELFQMTRENPNLSPFSTFYPFHAFKNGMTVLENNLELSPMISMDRLNALPPGPCFYPLFSFAPSGVRVGSLLIFEADKRYPYKHCHLVYLRTDTPRISSTATCLKPTKSKGPSMTPKEFMLESEISNRAQSFGKNHVD